MAITFDATFGGTAGTVVNGTGYNAETGSITNYNNNSGSDMTLSGDGACINTNSAGCDWQYSAGLTQCTVNVWVTFPVGGTSASNFEIFLARNTGGSQVAGLSLFGQGAAALRQFNGSYSTLVDSPTTFTAGTTYKFTVVRNGDTYTVYIDDSPTADMSATATAAVGATDQYVFSPGGAGAGNYIRIERLNRSDTMDVPPASTTVNVTGVAATGLVGLPFEDTKIIRRGGFSLLGTWWGNLLPKDQTPGAEWDDVVAGALFDPEPTGTVVNATGVSGAGAVGTTTQTFDDSVTATGVAGAGAVGTIAIRLDDSTAAVGVSGAGAVGTLTSVIALGVTGVAGVAAVGTATSTISDSSTATGVAGAGAVGTVTPTISITPTGVSSAGSVGTVTVSTSSGGTVNVIGVAGTGAVGTVVPVVAITAVGVSGAGAVGSVTVSTSSGAMVNATGVAAAGAVGTTIPSVAEPVTGVAGAGAVGTVAVQGTGSTVVTGVASVGAVGTVGLRVDDAITVTGTAGAGAVGGVAPTVQKPAVGVAATGAVGVVVIQTSTAVLATGVFGQATVGTVILGTFTPGAPTAPTAVILGGPRYGAAVLVAARYGAPVRTTSRYRAAITIEETG